MIKCFLCMDKGFLLVRDGLYETYTHCRCESGNRHRYDERPDGGRWYVPCVTEMLGAGEIETICVKNATEYAKYAKREVV